MSEYRQPWHRISIPGVDARARLQVVDPATAFELEPQIVEVLGEPLAMMLAAPERVAGSVWQTIAPESDGRSFEQVMLDADAATGLEVASNGLRMLAMLVTDAVITSGATGEWIATLWRESILGRLQVDGELIETVRDWEDLGLRPLAKWVVMVAQMRQTWGPLWVRDPYRLRVEGKDYGVPPPPVPVATQWAANLAQRGLASSAIDVVRSWTPVQLIEVVETAAYSAEHERRAVESRRADP